MTTIPRSSENTPLPSAEQESTVQAEPLLRSWLWQPNAIVFVSSACTMILELVAGRIVAPYVGVSLYTWTSVIGVVLAGMSLGNYVGGRLADRWASLRLLGSIFFLGGLSSLGVLAADTLGTQLPGNWSIMVQIVALTAALFFVPSAILGGVSPVVAKLAVRDLTRTGSTVGKIYAFSTVGSIAGTFATGFWLISWFGTHIIVWGVAVLLLTMGILFLAGGRWQALLIWAMIAAGGSAWANHQSLLLSSCTRETNYFCIKVRSEERDGETVRVLVLDRLVHSYTSIDNPKKIVYEYERVYAEATAYQAQRHDHLQALFIGGGGYTFPKYMAAVYPSSEIRVIEIDPGVTEIAHEMLGLPSDASIVTDNEDARLFLAREPHTRYNLIMGDAFNDFSVPYHLTTREFNERVRAWLSPDGLYMVNMIDGPRRDFLRAYTYTLRQTFQNVYVIPGIKSWRESPRVTFVLIATDTPLDLAAFKEIDAGDGEALLARQVLNDDQVQAMLSEGRAIALSDRYAPVDQLLAPVVRGEEAPVTPTPSPVPSPSSSAGSSEPQ